MQEANIYLCRMLLLQKKDLLFLCEKSEESRKENNLHLQRLLARYIKEKRFQSIERKINSKLRFI
jgi:hypothetical protein